jgi:hypothetical protein
MVTVTKWKKRFEVMFIYLFVAYLTTLSVAQTI